MAGSAVVGGSAAGTTFAVPPVVLGGIDSTGKVQTLLTDSTGRLSVSASRGESALKATGILSETGQPTLYTNTSAPATQVVYGNLLGLVAGDVVTGVVLRIVTAAAGSLPTTARFGIADSTGKILAISGNLNALANWAAGAMPYPFAAPYTVLASGGFFACFVVNGVWGTTQPLPMAQSGATPQAALTALGANAPPSFSWAAQTDLPAVGSSLTLTSGTNHGYYLAFY